MKKNEVPQDDENLLSGISEIQYATDENGKYVKVHSKGWEIKNDILIEEWQKLDQKSEEAKNAVKNGKKSPLYFHMIKNQMDYKLLAEYAETLSLLIRIHCKPKKFAKLKQETLQKYADIFDITIAELCTIPQETANSLQKYTNREIDE